MSSTSKIPSAVNVLRGILRKLKTNKEHLPPTKKKNFGTSSVVLDEASKDSVDNFIMNDTKRYVVGMYRQNMATTALIESGGGKDDKKTDGDELQQQKLLLAYEYLTLRQHMDERKRLQQLDSGVETKLSPREMSRRAAARAGLQLPDLDPNLK